jgi:hypothetical protein
LSFGVFEVSDPFRYCRELIGREQLERAAEGLSHPARIAVQAAVLDELQELLSVPLEKAD